MFQSPFSGTRVNPLTRSEWAWCERVDQGSDADDATLASISGNLSRPVRDSHLETSPELLTLEEREVASVEPFHFSGNSDKGQSPRPSKWYSSDFQRGCETVWDGVAFGYGEA